MQSNLRHRPQVSSAPLRALLVLGALLVGAGAVVACSSVLSNNDPACGALTTCCASIPGESATTCQQMATSAKVSSSGSSCAALLASYQSEGYCGGADGSTTPNGSTVPNVDGGSLPCELTGTCDGGTGANTSCVTLGSCPNGETYQTCSQTNGGVCTASIVFSDGASMACASCGDCSAASTKALERCYATPLSDSGPPPVVDSGPVCGTVPVLHPETVPGVYCPFTAAGAVHCAAGDQCCEAPVGQVSSCAPAATACPVTGSITWQCLDPLDCIGTDAGAACCATGATTYDSACGFYRGSGFTGSHCAASCGAGEIQFCSAANDPCSTPAQCTPFKVAGVVVGTCL